MPDAPDQHVETMHALDPSIQTENIAFDPAELVSCLGCSRKNPPNRLQCIYCGKDLVLKANDAAAFNPSLRKLELWEPGFNLILRRKSLNVKVETTASYLSTKSNDLRRILETDAALPVARVESESQAAILKNSLEKQGLFCDIISDRDLAADKPPARLSGIEISEDSFGFRDFNTGRVTTIPFFDLALLVPGSITTSRVDSLEKRRRNKETKMLQESSTVSDEPLLDIYVRHDQVGFRVHISGFDFSCLGPQKGMLAVENLSRLVGTLKAMAPNAKLINDYTNIRQSLGCVWEIETRKDSKGLIQTGFGKREFGAVSSTSNLNQFTKYSRLQWHLL